MPQCPITGDATVGGVRLLARQPVFLTSYCGKVLCTWPAGGCGILLKTSATAGNLNGKGHRGRPIIGEAWHCPNNIIGAHYSVSPKFTSMSVSVGVHHVIGRPMMIVSK